MYGDYRGTGQRRLGAGIATLAIHGVLAAGLLYGLAIDAGPPGEGESPVATFDLTEPPPPPPPPEPVQEPDRAPEAAGTEGREGEALPREAPVAKIPLSEVPAATKAESGTDTNAGAGTQGTGTGAGGSGSGEGGGGTGSAAVRISGALRDSDYPRELENLGVAGTTTISFRVRTDGLTDNCRVVGSSGSAVLDGLTCRLFTERFRFRPATTAAGRPVEATLRTSFTWGTRRRR